jgi:hypothetical protein
VPSEGVFVYLSLFATLLARCRQANKHIIEDLCDKQHGAIIVKCLIALYCVRAIYGTRPDELLCPLIDYAYHNVCHKSVEFTRRDNFAKGIAWLSWWIAINQFERRLNHHVGAHGIGWLKTPTNESALQRGRPDPLYETGHVNVRHRKCAKGEG